MELEKAKPVSLRSLGLGERWLQDKIAADPSILGLGDLEVAGREHHQTGAGRIDFLMRNTEEETYYEVEIMLGATDESHIIRTIEYWDLERQRRPQWDHRAVIVAEEITTRFFNVLRLLNRAVPLIAIKMSAFTLNGKVVLHPVTVLNVVEEISDPDVVDTVERVDRAYWEKQSPPTLAVMDKIVGALSSIPIEPRVTYNRGHIALGTVGRNFCWFHRRKAGAHLDIRYTSDVRDEMLTALQSGGVDASPKRADHVSFGATLASLENTLPVVVKSLRKAEEISH